MFEKRIPPVVNDQFFAPLCAALKVVVTRQCPKHDDLDFLGTGINRVISNSKSGRDFLQQVFTTPANSWSVRHFFGTLKSKRRLQMTQDVLAGICMRLQDKPAVEMPEDLPELDGFDLYAGDGHYHGAACHDKHANNEKYPFGQFFALNLRSGALHHLSAEQPADKNKREHDMHMLKRLSRNEIRQGAPKGRKVLYAWDRAGIDFIQWHRWKTGSGVYFISREKKNMKLFR